MVAQVARLPSVPPFWRRLCERKGYQRIHTLCTGSVTKDIGFYLNQAAAITITEMKDKITTLQTQVEQHRGEVLFREKVLVKMRKGHGAHLKERIQLKDETAKCVSELKAKKVLALHTSLWYFSLGSDLGVKDK